ncbi:hypothetical protein B0H14DRAFT_2653385 [Mycena olivaceomarginata]|nr:hypothetical protein B0H14DRAFT_2653385 [Mycena olivaceomarginata]
MAYGYIGGQPMSLYNSQYRGRPKALTLRLPILLAFFVRSPASLELFGMPSLDLRGRKVGGFRYFSSFVAAPDFATVAPQKIHVPGGKNNITGNHSQMGKRPEGGMRPERAGGRKKTRVGGWKEVEVVGKMVERGTATLQAYNVLQCWWLVREIIPRKTNPAGVQRPAVLVVGQRHTTPCSIGGWSEGNAEKLRKIFQKLLHSMTTSQRQNQTQDALNGLSPRSYDHVAHRHISVTTRCVTTRTRTTITARCCTPAGFSLLDASDNWGITFSPQAPYPSAKYDKVQITITHLGLKTTIGEFTDQ